MGLQAAEYAPFTLKLLADCLACLEPFMLVQLPPAFAAVVAQRMAPATASSIAAASSLVRKPYTRSQHPDYDPDPNRHNPAPSPPLF